MNRAPGLVWGIPAYHTEPRKNLLVWFKGDEGPSAHAMETAVRAWKGGRWLPAWPLRDLT